jgi:Spirocyclase AveC-like
MSTATADPVLTAFEVSAAPAVERRKARPVVGLAVLGIAITIFEAYVILKWITGPNFERTPVGPSEVPYYMKAGLTGLTIIGFVLWSFCMWHFLIKPWRREGHITLDGYFALSFVLIYWMDPYGDAIVPQFTYNSWLQNHGSWLADTPGVIMPNAERIPEPYLLTGPLYLWCIFGVVVIANKLMKRAQDRWPKLGNAGLISLTIGAFIVWDLFWELTFIRIGYWTYPTTPSWLTVYGDHWYRIHLSEPIFWGTAWALFACLRYFKNDKGQTLAERGLDQVKAGPKGKGAIRFFALYGVLCSIFFLFYVVGTNAIAIHGDSWPKDTLERSYFTNYVCGPDTGYACPGQGTPIPRDKSAHLDPDGELVPGEVDQAPPVTFAP